MEIRSWQLRLGVLLVILSAMTYVVHYFVFDDLHHILIYLVGDLAFVFIEVLLVTLIIHTLLDRREREARIRKMSAVIGVFFSEMGKPFILHLTGKGAAVSAWGIDLNVRKDWKAEDYGRAVKDIAEKGLHVKLGPEDIAEIKDLIVERRSFLLGMMENPNLLEHERFTEMLLALFHLQEELMNRGDFTTLPPSDISHLNIDVNRAFGLIAREWVLHMGHLQKNYPYLFSLAARTNPFDSNADSVVRE